ncbi:MAG: hypothetical protein EBQ92_08550 [Proteobacteria bacterium]|nr:hypothetical protein [Pseudomonadota bacterium]
MKSLPISSVIALIFMTLFYFALSPFIYFRHDDWLMLGNAVSILPRDWAFLWKPTWFTSPQHEEVWFFRPLFKYIIWVGYQLFSFNSFLWTLTHWLFLVSGTLLGGKTLTLLIGDSKPSELFVTLVLCSVGIHFASVVWVGEGMMNTPQIFLLMLATYFFAKSSVWSSLASVLIYSLALGFKESSAFLPMFLLAIAYSLNLCQRKKPLLIAHFGLMISYLIFRLGILPFNPGYKPHLTWTNLIKPLLFFGCFLFLPAISLILSHPRLHLLNNSFLKRLVLFVPFLGLLVAPHLGHSFFSPGWLLLPGFFSLWVLVFCLEPQKLKALSVPKWALFVLVLSALPVLYQVKRIRWLEWKDSQKGVHQYLRELPDSTTGIYIETCTDPSFPEVTFQRVVGAQENLEHIWNLNHSSPVTIRLLPCGRRLNLAQLPIGSVMAKWEFPNFTRNQ